MNQFFTDAASGNLPAFSLVDPYANYSEEDGDITVGEGYAALVIDAVMQGPDLGHDALVWVYDEHGGWYDHVPPRRPSARQRGAQLAAGLTFPVPTTSPGSVSRVASSRPGRRRTTSRIRPSTTRRS